ncbi:transcription factor TCP14-like [Hibiscus syriacus]|uniref:Transcription factor TCP14-like n=1 Tax=Hibiscus syriacus TaxID=106335 RepID=A0A6A2YJ14_HIBSY|nr:transcription factor TCP14-like [Hibiscus syriacus]
MNSTISVSSTAPPSLPPPRPHNDPTLLCCRKLRFQKNPSLNLNSLLKRGYFRISCLIAEINEEASKKVLEVEQKYNEIRKLIYDKWNEKIKSIPDFWFIANFDPNPYFEDAKLTKTFTFLDEGAKITATKIKWKEGMGLPNGVGQEKKGNKRQFAEERLDIIFVNRISPQPEDFSHIKPEINFSFGAKPWQIEFSFFSADKLRLHMHYHKDDMDEIHDEDADEEDFEDDEEVDKQGLPIGLQLIGRPWGEAIILRLGFAIEELCIKSRKTPASFYDTSKAK